MGTSSLRFLALLVALVCTAVSFRPVAGYVIGRSQDSHPVRQRLSINKNWRFSRFTSDPDSLSYAILKPWMLYTATDFFVSGAKPEAPTGASPGADVEYVQSSFDDSTWEDVNVPHDWAIKGPFGAPGVPNTMATLPSNGVGWYRRNVSIPAQDIQSGKSIFLDIDGAMSYAAIWLNGKLAGGWPYGYASFRVDLTPYVQAGDDNLLAIRLDNALNNSRWYPGAGIFRNTWLVSVDPVHVGQSGTFITTPKVSDQSATVNLAVQVDNTGNTSRSVDVSTEVYVYDPSSKSASGSSVASFSKISTTVAGGGTASVNGSVTIASPRLWGPRPSQTPNLYVAVTTLSVGGKVVDTYETRFGIRTIAYDADTGISVNGQHVRIQGTNNHHDHGSLGAAFHLRAAERQLGILQDMGCNALRMSHNPPAPELLDLADELGFLVLDEIFDAWEIEKKANDFHLIFDDWHEPDLRAFIRRDRNHPSIIVWSVGNEVGEQRTTAGGTIATTLRDIAVSEDATRQITSAFNVATAGSGIADAVTLESLNYQGEGLGPAGQSSFPAYHAAYGSKALWSSESASAVSTRGTYLFPVTSALSATEVDGAGGNATAMYVSAYELYGPSWGSSPDKVFSVQDTYSYVAGEFVWSGFDYLGEPTPYADARSSYFGIIDLAGFRKDRFYIYQARWRPDLPMAHLLPHWTWPSREGLVTPVHVFSNADEAELFINDESQGRLQRTNASTYRFRWDNVTYTPGTVHVVAYKDGAKWAEDRKSTVGAAAGLHLTVDRSTIAGDGYDLAYVTIAVVDADGNTVPTADTAITVSVSGNGVAGELAATDNGDPTDMTAFPSATRKAFSGLALAVVRATSEKQKGGVVTVSARAAGLRGGQVTVNVAGAAA